MPKAISIDFLSSAGGAAVASAPSATVVTLAPSSVASFVDSAMVPASRVIRACPRDGVQPSTPSTRPRAPCPPEYLAGNGQRANHGARCKNRNDSYVEVCAWRYTALVCTMERAHLLKIPSETLLLVHPCGCRRGQLGVCETSCPPSGTSVKDAVVE